MSLEMERRAAEANAWVFLKYVDPQYGVDRLTALNPEQTERFQILVDMLMNVHRRGAREALEWAIGRPESSVRAELIRLNLRRVGLP